MKVVCIIGTFAVMAALAAVLGAHHFQKRRVRTR
jgi:hypothetical protein